MNPLLLDLPETIQTERLVLRVPRAGDGHVVNAAVRESLAELRSRSDPGRRFGRFRSRRFAPA